MKEASGELSMTAVAVVAIAAIGALFLNLIWPSIKGSIVSSTKCSSAFNCRSGKAVNSGACTGKTCYCDYYDEKGNIKTGDDSVQCPNPE